MSRVSSRVLKDQLSGYLRLAEPSGQETVEQMRLAEMASGGLVLLPKRPRRTAFQGPALPNRGKLASEMVIEDRR